MKLINILYFICFFLSLLIIISLLLFFSKKGKKIYQKKQKFQQIQLPELQDNKFFVLPNGKRLKFYKSNFSDNEKFIYFYIHDIYGLSEYMKQFILKSKKNMISFIQTGYYEDDNNKKDFANILYEIQEIIKFFENLYPNKKIVLVSEGFSLVFLYYFFSEKYNFIFINPILETKYINLSFKYRLKLKIPYLANLNKEIKLEWDYNSLINDKKFHKNNCILELNYLYLYHCLKIIKKFKAKNMDNIFVLQSTNSIFYSKWKTEKKFININHIILLENNSHLLSFTKDIENIFLFNLD